MEVVTQGVAAKLKQEAEEKEEKSEQRRLDLIKQAGKESLKKEFGKGQPLMNNAFKERLGKACKRHGFMERLNKACTSLLASCI